MNLNEMFERTEPDRKYLVRGWRSYVGEMADGPIHVCRTIVQTDEGQTEVHDFLMDTDVADIATAHLRAGQSQIHRLYLNDIIKTSEDEK